MEESTQNTNVEENEVPNGEINKVSNQKNTTEKVDNHDKKTILGVPLSNVEVKDPPPSVEDNKDHKRVHNNKNIIHGGKRKKPRGKRIGKYELGRTIGRGKYSKVKYCYNIETRETYAIKIMSLKDIKRGKMENQLRREIVIMKMISHVNVVQLHEVLQTTRNIYIVMELVTGGELFDKIMSVERFPEDVARSYFQQLINGLSYCHAHGIAHRDLKPENLLINNAGFLKITDFGLSTLANQNHPGKLLTTTCGTPNYVAPEVISQRGYNGFRADVWSCGVILYVMLAGYLPFEDKNIQKLFKKIEKGHYECPKFFSKDFKDLISKMLHVDHHRRIDIKGIKKHKWFRINYKETQKKIKKITHKPSKSDIQKSILMQEDDEINIGKKRESKEIPIPGLTGKGIGEGFVEGGEKMNAFDLTTQLLMGSISVLATGKKSDIIVRRSRFLSSYDYNKTKDLLLDGLQKLGTNPKNKKKNCEDIINCYIYDNNELLLTFIVVIIRTISEFTTFVEFQRRTGDSLEFINLYKKIEKYFDSIGMVARSKHVNQDINPLVKSINENHERAIKKRKTLKKKNKSIFIFNKTCRTGGE